MDIQIFCLRIDVWKVSPSPCHYDLLDEYPRAFRAGIALLAPFSGAWIQRVVVNSILPWCGLAIVHPYRDRDYPHAEHWRWVLAAWGLAEHPGFSRPAPAQDLDSIPF